MAADVRNGARRRLGVQFSAGNLPGGSLCAKRGREKRQRRWSYLLASWFRPVRAQSLKWLDPPAAFTHAALSSGLQRILT